MKKQTGRQVTAWITVAGLAAALAGCAGMGGGGPSASELSRYRCNGGMEFTVSFANGAATLKGARGDDVLLRDAGGQGAQTVYSNPRMRAEFGLGAGGREAVLHYPVAPLATRCVRELAGRSRYVE